MSKKKKNGKKHTVEKLLLATALIQLIQTIFEFVEKLVE